MKCDFDMSNKICDLSGAAIKCRQMSNDLSEMVDSTNDKYFAFCKKRLFIYTSIVFDYAVQLDEGLKELCEAEIIKNAPALTTAQGATKTTSSLTQEE